MDHRRNRALSLADLVPDDSPLAPSVEWSTHQDDSPSSLYSTYEPSVAGNVVAMTLEAKEHEPRATATLLDVLPEGTRAHGLEFRVKSPHSLARKFALKMSQGMAPHRIARKVSDQVRYTIVSPSPKSVLSDAATTASRLQDRGWVIVEAEHSFVRGNPYKAVHLMMRTPGGFPIEVQFHSEKSQEIKDTHHVAYETMRDPNQSAAARRQAWEEMVSAWSTVPTPAGLTEATQIGGVGLKVKDYTQRR